MTGPAEKLRMMPEASFCTMDTISEISGCRYSSEIMASSVFFSPPFPSA